MPLGGISKEDVRKIAKKYELEVSDRVDSQDFYNGDINDIIQAEPKEGNFVDKNGKILGTHLGIWNFTIGQRRGLGISADRPLYVIGLDKEKNEVMLGYVEDGAVREILATNIKWLSVSNIPNRSYIKVKVRSSQDPIDAEFISKDNDTAIIRFNEEQRAIASGQSVVFYDDNDYVLGGGLIEAI